MSTPHFCNIKVFTTDIKTFNMTPAMRYPITTLSQCTIMLTLFS